MGADPPTLLLATANEGKRRELERLLPATVRLLALSDVAVVLPPKMARPSRAMRSPRR